MGQLTAVHGVGQQYVGRHQILDKWTPALADGLERATGCRARRPELDLAFYGDLFRPAGPWHGAKSMAEAEAAVQFADLDAEELAELTEAVEEIVTPTDLTVASARADKGKSLPVPVQILVGAIERHFPPTSGILHLGVLRQVRRYLRDSSLKAEVDQIAAAAAADAIVLIGHSLGSVVAYEFLRQHPSHSVRQLVTLGSPLGLRMVRRRLPTSVLAVACWINVRDRHDPVAAAGALDRWYADARECLVVNGSDAHAAERYLDSKPVGEALIDVMPELGQ